MDPYQSSIEVVWHNPAGYDPTRHGPPYMPTRLGSDEKARVRKFVAGHVAPRVAQSLVSGAAPLSAVLVVLRAASFIHQTHHWQTRGPQFYADHLLFQRLYDESQPIIDQVAERAVGAGDVALVDAVDQSTRIAVLVKALVQGSDSQMTASLRTESVVLSVLAQALKMLGGNGALSRGTTNLLEGAADVHETFVYLLTQRSARDAYDYGR
jgi:starvation-inducible DNA-binding protein